MQIETGLYVKYAKHKTRALVLLGARDEQEEKQIFSSCVYIKPLTMLLFFSKLNVDARRMTVCCHVLKWQVEREQIW